MRHLTNKASLRFYEELNDFLPIKRKKICFVVTFELNPSIKDLIESLGVPHTEIDLIIVNGKSVGFDYKVQNGDYISVYPVFEGIDITPINHLHSRPLRNLKFIADVHLGKLTKYLRLLGFDVTYKTDIDDKEIINLSLKEIRVILTKDKGILKNNLVTHGYYVRNSNPKLQIREMMLRFDLIREIHPFTRCLNCNSLLIFINKDAIQKQLEINTKKYYKEFFYCSNCQKIYWKGSHYQRMQDFINELLKS